MQLDGARDTISVVIITKNEAGRIARCLESVKWANEIVIVDDMSTDITFEICRKYTNKIIQHKSNGNFDRQRNIGIDNASGDWILQMDADEIVTDSLKRKILGVIDSPADYIAFKFKRKNFFLGHFLKYAGAYHYMTKLFRKDKARYVGSSVFETLKVEGKIGIIDEDIEHHAFSSIYQLLEKLNFYTTVMAKTMFKEKGTSDENKIRYNLTIKPLKLFWKSYFKKKGYKDGMYGLIWCLFNVIGPFVLWSKYWELIKNKTNQNNICA